jgi:protein CMS1
MLSKNMESMPSELLLTSSPANAVLDTSSWEKQRTLDNLSDFLQKFVAPKETLSEAPKEKGCPHTIVVAAAGLRAADMTRCVTLLSSIDGLLIINRALRSFSSQNGTVTKLFAKHIKIKEAVETCKKTRYLSHVHQPCRESDLY